MVSSAAMARVYISSTFLDLQVERRAAAEAVRMLGHHSVAMEDYVACDERPLAKCRADVAASQAYVGILGWRYGYCPPEGDGRSITELEYAEATRVGIPRLVFLSPPVAAWPGMKDPDLARVTALRERLGGDHTAAPPFTSAAHLQTLVVASLANSIGRGRDVPRLLPYHCDRDAQHTALAVAIREAAECDEVRPLVVVAHGEGRQAVGSWVEVVRDTGLAELVGAAEVTEHEVRWPRVPLARFGPAFDASLGGALLHNPAATSEAIAAQVALHPGPLLLRVELGPAELGPELPGQLAVLRERVARWAPRARNCPVVVLVAVTHPEPPTGLLAWLGLARRPPTRAWLDAAPQGLLLPELQDVETQDAREWARSERVLAWTDHADLLPDVEEHFRAAPRQPMLDAAGGLRRILARHAGARRQ